MNENIVELQTENGITLQCKIYDIVSFEEQAYGILCPVKEEYNEIILMKVLEEDDNCYFSGIEDEEEFKKFVNIFRVRQIENFINRLSRRSIRNTHSKQEIWEKACPLSTRLCGAGGNHVIC